MASEPKGRVVIADDDAHTRNLLKELVESWGHEALMAQNGEEAIAHLCALPVPDLALLDLMMPKVDGFGVLKKIRETPALRAMPVILLTADSDVDVKLKSMELGADDYVTKPFRLGDLQNRVSAVLAKKRLSEAQPTQGDPQADFLTGVGTYPQLKEILAHEVARAGRYGRPLSALMVAMDESDSQATGSANPLLSALAESLRRTFRVADRVFRIDFDAFVVLLPETEIEGALIAAARFVEALRDQPLEAQGTPRKATVSVGLADFPRFGKDKADELVRAAHHALERTRHLGPSRVQAAQAADLEMERAPAGR
ncbi:MAG TPA: response regulator [Myxococcales bacterium]|jgi:diguanylate cyclase (GGDEF)-like protein